MGLAGSGASRRPGSIVRVLRTERWVRPAERAGSEGVLYAAACGSENRTTALAGEGDSPFGGWRHHLARWEACHLILSRLRLLANRVTRFPVDAQRT